MVMKTRMIILLGTLCLSSAAALAACPRVPGEEEDRRANAGCLIVQADKVLLLTHRWGGKLGVPGGTREEGELAQCTAWREAREETGLAVTVGQRLAVMRNGFHLYRCYPQSSIDTDKPVPVPRSGLSEVSAIDWYPLSSLSRDRWRFYYQFDQFVAVAEKAMRSGTTAVPDSASDALPVK